ncbi:MAG: LVIVD repeat-containing protein [Gaiellales bacterium]
MSVEQTRGRIDCGTQGVPEKVSAERFRGIRIFDITDVKKPKQIGAIQTCRGSHTHTLVIDPDDKANIYVYGSGTGSVRSGDELAGCSGLDPKEDPNTALFSIDVIQVPLAAPATAKIVNRPRIFADPKSGALSGLWQGGDHGPGTQRSRMTNQCHDITVFPEVGLAAGACSGNGILMDISDPVHPVRLDHVVDKSFAYWHSATFNIDGTKVVFTDEWGGGTRPRCRSTDPPTWGGDAIFDIVDRKLRFASYYKMPAPQTEQENCVAHNGSLIPVPGRDVMVQGWYQGGLSVFDFTDSTKPVEIAFFDRGPIDAKQLITGGYWSTYWYNGHIYGTEIARGVDVFRLKPSEHLSQHEIDAAMMVRSEELNTQLQSRIVWPASSVVARAYLDQLTRSKGIQPERARAVKAALDRADELRSGREKDAAARLDQLDALATQLESDAGAANGRDAARLRSLAATIKGRTAKLR